MAIKDKLDAAWVDNIMHDATFEARAVMQSGYWEIQRVVAEIDRIVALASFANVDAEIKAEGQTIRNIFNSAKAALDTHTAFLEWSQPS